MYCNSLTVKLAISKGYKHCTCSNGGYPDCICGDNSNSPLRLDDLQRWLRSELNIDVEIPQHGTNPFNNRYRVFILHDLLSIMNGFKYIDYNKHYESNSYDEALESGLVTALELI